MKKDIFFPMQRYAGLRTYQGSIKKSPPYGLYFLISTLTEPHTLMEKHLRRKSPGKKKMTHLIEQNLLTSNTN